MHTISVTSWQNCVDRLGKLRPDYALLPARKIDILIDAIHSIYTTYENEHLLTARKVLGADDFLPIFIYCISHCGIKNLMSLKEICYTFCDPRLALTEAGYCIATLDAATNYLSQ